MSPARLDVLVRLAAGCALFVACTHPASSGRASAQGDDKAEAAPLSRVFDKEILPEQNWDWETREDYWFRTQGSQLLPYDWFLALEEAGSKLVFRRDEHMNALRFVTSPPSPGNPDGLPIGFSRDPRSDWVGFTCAACHTGQVEFGGTSLVIDGAPTLAHFDRFLERLVAALKILTREEEKQKRFATKVLGGGHSEVDRVELIKEVRLEYQLLKKRYDANKPGAGLPADYPGFGRLDAYAHIFNQVTAVDLGIPDNADPTNGPASYPFLWGAPQSDVVQWNGAGKNRKGKDDTNGDSLALLGPLVRNAVEVIGVFGRLEFEKNSWRGYDSDVHFHNLGLLEQPLCTLHAPKWPEKVFGERGEIDDALAAAGAEVYAKNCQGCHELRDDEEVYDATMVGIEAIGTDPSYARNTHDREGKTGILEGKRINLIPIVGGERLGKKAKSHEILRHAVVGSILRHPIEAYKGMRAGQCGSQITMDLPQDEQRAFVVEALLDGIRALEAMPLAYKARPLDGIWATAPYLHNGSVPNLKEFLKAPSVRVDEFYVGSRTYDPESVGFESTKSEGATLFDTSLPGNSNLGHDKSADLSDRQRRELLEYLKTL